MAEIKETPFTGWEFTEDEIAIATNLPDLNRKFIQNELAIAATERALLPFDPNNPLKFQMEAEYLRGKLDILAYILNRSDDAKAEAIAQLVRSAESQNNS